ncbi:hypothetical protein GH714_003027 [Hevea brasiliensis]|uniref:RNA helicase n=1 Tax=Hevea brasiliensis TaxID=3981 RepID=A0A6A6LW28_HEVBR|nr:hypothetical protein GH714_003027 [Hevea brasiliensis]
MSQFWKPGAEKPRILDDEEGVSFSSPPLSHPLHLGTVFCCCCCCFCCCCVSNLNVILCEFTFLFCRYGYASIEKQRLRLPVYKYRTAILYLVETHATTVIVGETGSGKTTQIPQYLKEAGWADGGRVIACTQPRRLAVQAVASRVAEEMGVKLGEEVGYTIRFEDLANSVRRVIMVDEAHERSISTDILLGLLKKIQRRRPELRLIISSATIEAKSMSAFFQTSKRRRGLEADELGPRKDPAILSVEGRGFNVQIHYVEEPVADYVRAAVSTVLSIHDQEPPGDSLVFLTGQDDIDAAVQLLTEEAQANGKNSSGLIVLPLYSGLSRMEQDLVFSPTPRGKRKVVISTNIAETSLTLEGIVYVVDSGFSKQRFYNPISDVENLVVAPISKASARQRAGRAGRIRPGKCYRLECLALALFDIFMLILELGYALEYLVPEQVIYRRILYQLPAQGIPEMQRSNLVSCVIQLKALGIDNILGFDWPASPAPEAMIRALEVLYSLGVLDDDAKLTSPVGFQAAEIPLDPMIAKDVIFKPTWMFRGNHYHCCCSLHPEKVIEIREQLRRIALRIGIVLKSCERDMLVVRKAVTAGFFANACNLEAYSHNGMYKTVRGSQEVYIHPSSVLFRVNPKWVIYQSLVSTDRQYMRNVITIDPSWLTEAAPHFFQHQRPDPIGR